MRCAIFLSIQYEFCQEPTGVSLPPSTADCGNTTPSMAVTLLVGYGVHMGLDDGVYLGFRIYWG